MKRAASVLLLAATVSLGVGAGGAHAQPAVAPDPAQAQLPPGGMPDPRMMSGIPRPDPQVPVGTITVRVIHGELAKLAPGTTVWLAAVGQDGAVTATKGTVAADGRATFAGLDSKGAVTYTAFTLLGDDRLESQSITLDATSGVRLMLVGRKQDAANAPVGEPIDEENPLDKIPAGEVRVALDGAAPPTTKVELIEIPPAGTVASVVKSASPVKQGNDMTVVFTGVATGPDHLYTVRTTIAGKAAQGAPFLLSSLAGVSRQLRPGGKLTAKLDAAGEIEGDHVSFQIQYTFENLSGAPVDPGMDGIVLALPAGAEDVQIPDTLQAKVSVDAKGVVWHGVVPTGETAALVAFTLPIDSQGTVKFTLTPSVAITGEAFVFEKTGGDAALVTPKGMTVDVKPLGDGRDFFFAKPILIGAGETFEIVATGVEAGAPPAAQEGSGMPDPRRISGTPRAEPKQDPGSLSIRVVYGEMARIAKGATVHLIGIHEDGTLEKLTKTVDESGHVDFPSLSTDGSVSYFAYCLLGDDRLESKLVTMRPMVGTVMMLSGRRHGKDGKPVGKPVDDAVDESLPVKIPSGEVWVAIDGDAAPGTPVELVDAGAPAGTPPLVSSAQAVPNGQGALVARFTKVPVSPDKVWVPRITLKGRTYLAKPFMMSKWSGVGRMLRAYDQLLLRMHMTAELVDDQVEFQTEYDIGNMSGMPWNPGKKGVLLPVPAGATGIQVPNELQPLVRIEPGRGVVWRGKLPAGIVTVDVFWQMPVADGKLDVHMPLPAHIVQSQLVVVKAGDSEITPPPGLKAKLQLADNGKQFWLMGPLELDAGQAVEFSLAGLPEHPLLDRASRQVAGLIVLLAVVFALFLAARVPAAPTVPAPPLADAAKTAVARRKQLVKQREALYDELVKLEKQRAKGLGDAGWEGGAGDEELQRKRAAAIAKLALVLREIDETDGRGGVGSPGAGQVA